MSYAIAYRGKALQAGYFAHILRRRDNAWWDETNSMWVVPNDPAAVPDPGQITALGASALSTMWGGALTERNVPLIESIATYGSQTYGTFTYGAPLTHGVYSGTAGFTPTDGELYTIVAFDVNSTPIAVTEDLYNSIYDKDVLAIINDVQTELRFPLSADLSDSHAKLLLSFMNRVIRDYLPEEYAWDEVKVSGSIFTTPDVSVYPIAPMNANEVDVVRSLQIGTAQPMTPLGDDKFRSILRTYSTPSQPLFSRRYARSGGVLLVEIAPTPDNMYQIDYEALQRPARLVNPTDIPMLDPDILTIGTLMLAIKEQGRDYSAEAAAFGLKLGLEGGTQGDSNWEDMEPV